MSLASGSAERAKYGYLLQLAREQIQALETDDLFAFDRILAAKRTLIESLVDGRTLVAADPVLRTLVTDPGTGRGGSAPAYRKVAGIMRGMEEMQQFKGARGLRAAAPPGAPRRRAQRSGTAPRSLIAGSFASPPLPAGERFFLCRARTSPMKLPTVKKATKEFEAWLGERTTLVEADLEFKHQTMAQDAFSFLRGTYYRWAQVWPKAVSPDADAAGAVGGRPACGELRDVARHRWPPGLGRQRLRRGVHHALHERPGAPGDQRPAGGPGKPTVA